MACRQAASPAPTRLLLLAPSLPFLLRTGPHLNRSLKSPEKFSASVATSDWSTNLWFTNSFT